MTRVVALLLCLEPLRFALEALTVLPTLADRGAAAAVELVIHGAVAAVAAAGAVALWNGRAEARQLASIAVVLSTCRVVQSLYWSALPASASPGQAPYLAAGGVAIGVMALLLIRRVPPSQ